MRVLIVDDERNQRESLAGFLKKIGYSVATAESAQTALAYMYTNPVDVVLSDHKMPYMTGTDLLKEIKSRHPAVVVVLITAFGTVEKAVEAMKLGAWDFMSKPVDLDELEQMLKEIQTHLDLIREPRVEEVDTEEFLAESPAMLKILDQARRVAKSRATLLITGETGVGKEVLARYIHTHSDRKNEEMVAVNCAALPSHLIESELFGHEKGAFTGATSARIGRFEEVDGSTLFLDEIGDLPLDMQTKLLRFLESGEFQRIGDNKILKSDVRILAATNVDLEHAIQIGEFREDLYYRLNVVQFEIPPLRDRLEDIEILARAFLKTCSHREQRTGLSFSEEALRALRNYPFPGNVRELRNLIERAVLLSSDSQLTLEDLHLPNRDTQQPDGDLKRSVQRLEADLIRNTLQDAQGNQSECARRLGISERVLRYKLQKYDLH